MKWRETAGREASRRLTSEFFEELSSGSLKKNSISSRVRQNYGVKGPAETGERSSGASSPPRIRLETAL